MTLEEAIIHCKEVAVEQKRNYLLNLNEGCLKCANDHKQLADWLSELKLRREVEERMKESEWIYRSF